MDELRRRGMMEASSADPDLLYHIEDYEAQTTTQDTGLMLFTVDQDYTALTEWQTDGKSYLDIWRTGKSRSPYCVGLTGVGTPYADSYFSGARYYRYQNAETYPITDDKVHRHFAVYDAANKTVKLMYDLDAKPIVRTNVTWTPQTGTLQFGDKYYASDFCVLRQLTIYKRRLDEDELIKWVKEVT